MRHVVFGCFAMSMKFVFFVRSGLLFVGFFVICFVIRPLQCALWDVDQDSTHVDRNVKHVSKTLY